MVAIGVLAADATTSDPGGATEQPAANTLVPLHEVEDVTNAKRAAAIISIEIDGKTLQSLGLQQHLNGFEVVHDIAQIGEFRIKFFDPLEDSWGLTVLKEGSQVAISIGYEPDKMEDHGLFLMEEPQFQIGRTGKYVEVHGYAPAIVMTKAGHVQKSWTKVTDSDIAEIIAQKYGIDTDIEKTTIVYEELVQAAETDYDFLMRRANYQGYSFYVDKKLASNQGVLHFHRPRFTDTKKSLSVYGSKSVIIDLSLAVQATRSVLSMYKAQIDWKHLKVYEASSQEKEDPLYQAAKAQDPSFVYAPDLVNISPKWVQIHDGLLLRHELLEWEMQETTEKNSQASRWIVVGIAKTVGLEFLRAGGVVRLKGADRFDGPWLVVRVRHSYYAERTGTRSGFISEFVLKRTFNKPPTLSKIPQSSGESPSPFTDVTADIPSEGEVGVG